MTIEKLFEWQEDGLLEARETEDGKIVIANRYLDEEQQEKLLKVLGWTRHEEPFIEIMKKTNKFVRNIKPYLSNLKEDWVPSQLEVVFYNARIMDTIKYINRVKLICKKTGNVVVIVQGSPGQGGKFAVYTSDNYFNYAVFKCNSYRDLGNWLCNYYGGSKDSVEVVNQAM